MKRLRLLVTENLVLVFSVIGTGFAQTYTDLYNFNPNAINGPLQGVLAQGRDGHLYGTTAETTLKFHRSGIASIVGSGNRVDGWGLTLGTDGNFYGVSYAGGANSCGPVNCGYVFKMTHTGTITDLHEFTCGTDGAYPVYAPIEGSDGDFYGVTYAGGASGDDCSSAATEGYGVVYKITPSGVLTTLHTFTVLPDGSQPQSQLVQGTDGYLYGTAESGGSTSSGLCNGTIFKISHKGSFSVLHCFGSADAGDPVGPLIQASDGNVYGTASEFGTEGQGAVFRITPGGTYSEIHNFPDFSGDGSQPTAGVMQATDGYLYGTTQIGGTGSCSGGATNSCGILFRMSLSGANYMVLHNFEGTTGSEPTTVPLFQNTNGILYGGTQFDGTGDEGVFYSLDAGLPPFISTLTNSGKVGQTVEIIGQGLTGTTSVEFGAGTAAFTVVSDTYMTAVVPGNGTTTHVKVVTPTGALVSNKVFRVIPTITSFTPTTGIIGTTVVITGTSLTQTSRVTFGGVAATAFTVNSDTQVTVTVPTGAITGKIAITTPGGTATSSAAFTVT
jgi:uncharacterized repeat protein (TIGR03803 family)